ncbi:MAG TPA: hypothetical protein VGN86_03790 [Pyrinomonadaceae bacterium]|jgi:hypothetical protein|nr:hypothetical protein [Pyrinomonadaceae bacterium]
MLIRIDTEVVNTDAIAHAHLGLVKKDSNPPGTPPYLGHEFRLTISFIGGAEITVDGQVADRVWDFLSTRAERIFEANKPAT